MPDGSLLGCSEMLRQHIWQYEWLCRDVHDFIGKPDVSEILVECISIPEHVQILDDETLLLWKVWVKWKMLLHE